MLWFLRCDCPVRRCGRGGNGGLALGSSSSSGVACCRNFSAQRECHCTISASALLGSASAGRSIGKGSPVSGCLRPNLFTAAWRNGTCSSGSSNVSIDSQRTKPRGVRVGIEGAAKSSLVGLRECWQPMDLQTRRLSNDPAQI